MVESSLEQELPATRALLLTGCPPLNRASLRPHWSRSGPFRELVIILSLGLFLFALAFYYDAFNWWDHWALRNGQRFWQEADEMITYLLAYFGLAFGWFSFRRWRELQAEAAARRRAERLKDEFSHMVSHELRTPLTTIREGVTQIAEGILGPTTPEQREFLSIVLGDIERLSRIINDLLDVTKIETGSLRLSREHVNIVRMARQQARLFEPAARAKGLRVRTDFSGPEIEIYIDPDKISQVFANLLDNAMKFTEKGEVTLNVEDMGEQVSCTVRDTGRGIAPDELSRVFQKYYQVGRMPAPGRKSTGLGLPIAKGIVESHGGTMSVASDPGAGTTFTFVLPKTPV
jgi:signal transduction histidine kinase